MMWLLRRNRPTVQKSANRRPGMAVKWSAKASYGIKTVGAHLGSWLSIILLVFLITVPISLFVWLLFFTNIFEVQAVTIVDAREDTQRLAKEIIEERIADLPLGRNIFFVDSESLETEILTRLPQVRTVHVTRKLPGTIKAIIQEKDPSLLLLSTGDYFFVDAAGVVYEEARLETLPGVVLPTVKNDDRESRVAIGVAAVDEPFVAFVLDLQDLLPDRIGWHVAEIHIPSLAAREVHVTLDNNWRLLFDVTRGAAGQIEVLKILLDESIEPEEREVLQYVDLRIPNRVYYKTQLGDGER